MLDMIPMAMTEAMPALTGAMPGNMLARSGDIIDGMIATVTDPAAR
jgi:hypothetical protein